MKTIPDTTAKQILLCLPLASQDGADKFDGVMQYVTESGVDWRIRLDRLSLNVDRTSPSDFAALDGIIMDGGVRLALCRAAVAAAIPLVAIDWRHRGLLRSRRHHVEIHADDAGIGRKAAETLLAVGAYASFACLPYADDIAWSHTRQNAFVHELRSHGKKAVRLDAQRPLAPQLLALAHPTVVFAVNDLAAMKVLEAAEKAGLKVPQDISVLGVDNDRFTCLTTNPPLASLQPDFVTAGRLAAQALDRLLGGTKTAARQTYPVRDIIRRRSLEPPGTAARIVQRAKELLRDTPGLANIDTLAAQIGVSRRLLDIRFREHEGTSILDYIQRQRLEVLKTRLLTTTQSIGEICTNCGFGSGTYPLRLFKRLTGMTMREFRNRSRGPRSA